MTRSSSALFAAAVSAWAASCALGGFERGRPVPASGGQGGIGGMGGTGGMGGADTCQHAEVPPVPGVTDAGAGVDFQVAVRSVDVGEAPGAIIGLDLDRFCSCQGEGPSCASSKQQCDLDAGRDNAMRTLFQLVAPLFLPDTPSSFYSGEAERGAWTLVLDVSGYNGMPDDDRVRLVWYVSPGIESPMTPAWDGNDVWRISDTSFEADMVTPRHVDANAYVSGGTLVATLGSSQPEIALGGNMSYFKLRLTAPTVMARIEQTATGWSLRDGLIAGRLAEPDMFAAISSFREGGQFICTDGPLYADSKMAICSALDIHAGVASPASPCDALSFGIAFTADPALAGTTVPTTEPAPVCTPGFDPIDDRCSFGAGGAGGAGGGM